MVGRGDEQPDIVRQLLDVEAVPGKPQYLMAPEASGYYRQYTVGHPTQSWGVRRESVALFAGGEGSAHRQDNLGMLLRCPPVLLTHAEHGVLLLLQEPLLLAACEYPLHIEWHRCPSMQAALQGQLQMMLHRQIVKTRCAVYPLQVVSAFLGLSCSRQYPGMHCLQLPLAHVVLRHTCCAVVLCSLLATIEERISANAKGTGAGDGDAVDTWTVKSQPHIPLLQRSREPSMQERLQKLGKTTLGQ